ncbi:peptidase M1 [Acidianus sulfidivorans JP7]|uniref:Peptidase M1 n=1 Tax=Acidianus sulfidivorans JP7 TaxID=619593 RepID=A0A2U9IJX0_9CREN|nr:M1 family aminopeptidase [Acidianus sulfidivorans]AWR96339.1 peptidase M1 [Acidianus sulfidivorans JP7]
MVLDRIGKDYILKEYTLNYPKNYTFNIRHCIYTLEINENVIRGKAEVLCNGENVELDAVHFNLLNVKVDGKNANYYYDGKKLTIKDKVENKIEIEYEVKPTQGIRFINLGDYYEISTVGEVDQSGNWIPSINYPGVKYTTEFIIKVKKPYVAISNGELKERTDEGEYSIYHWVMNIPHSSYLNSIAIGIFSEFKDSINGIPLEYYLPKGYEDYAWNLSVTKEAMKFFTSYIGDYPYSRYAQVVLFSMNGGMEYISSTHLTWRVLHDKIADKNYSADSLIAHELAHQWFGDLITTKDWSNIWLNEGFASYFEAMFIEYYKGKEEFIYNLYSKLKVYLEETEKYTRPIVTRYYKWGDELFDRHTYNKGALVLNMLRNYLGDEVFKEGIREYIKRYKFKNTDTEDFKKVMEEVSGKDLTWIFDQFIYSAGHPIVNVNQDGNKINVSIQDFQIPLEIKHEGKVTIITDSNATFEGSYVCVDPKFKVLAEINDNQSEENLILESKDSEDVICRIRAVKSLSRFSDIKAIQALKDRLNDFWGVAYESALSLGKIQNDDALNVLIQTKIDNPKVKVGVAKALGNFKFNQKAKDYLLSLLNEESYHIKAEAIVSLGKINIIDTKDEIIKHFEDKSYIDLVPSAVIEALSYFGDDDSYKFILEKGVRNKSEPIRASSARHIWRFGNKSLEILKFLLKDPSPIVRGNAIRAINDLKAHSLLKEVVENEDETYTNRSLALRFLSKSNQ